MQHCVPRKFHADECLSDRFRHPESILLQNLLSKMFLNIFKSFLSCKHRPLYGWVKGISSQPPENFLFAFPHDWTRYPLHPVDWFPGRWVTHRALTGRCMITSSGLRWWVSIETLNRLQTAQEVASSVISIHPLSATIILHTHTALWSRRRRRARTGESCSDKKTKPQHLISCRELKYVKGEKATCHGASHDFRRKGFCQGRIT